MSSLSERRAVSTSQVREIRFCARQTHVEEHVRFLQLMANRLAFGLYRHGEKGEFDAVQDYLKRLKNEIRLYEKTGNTEHLVNAANYADLEFHNPLHPDAHFRSVDSHGKTR